MSRTKPSRIILTSPQQQHTLQLHIDDSTSSLVSTLPIHVSDIYLGTNPASTVQTRLATLENAGEQDIEQIAQSVLSQIVIPPMDTTLNYTWTGTNTFQRLVCQDIDCVSDENLKTDICDILDSNSSRLHELACYKYRFKADANRVHYGVLAQEVQKVWPELVHTVDTHFLSVDYQSILTLMLHEIQRLRRDLDKLVNKT